MPIVREIITGAVRHGAPLDVLCRKVGIAPADIYRSDEHPGFEKACLAWEHAVTLTKNPLLGLHLGEQASPSILGLIGYLMQNSETLGEAFAQVAAYGKVATNMFTYSMRTQGDSTVLRFEPATLWKKLYPNGARQATDQAMAGTLNVFRQLSGRPLFPQTVKLSNARRAEREYERVFQVQPSFKQPYDELYFTREQMRVPVLAHDRTLFKAFEAMVAEQRKRKKAGSFPAQVTRFVVEECGGQVPSLDVLAARFNMTARTLQRRLTEGGTTYRELTSTIKVDIASRLLRSTDQKVSEIAAVLGYSGPRAFRRAFLETTGRTPEGARGKAARR